jgi:hypothetical protein
MLKYFFLVHKNKVIITFNQEEAIESIFFWGYISDL